ncbi:Non-structural maintenance of chromosomes element 1 [Branchiostoma belcheri]|nr:Non-structural maintenance of chromosomes element 1 [Branchiostoma belcheri]
MATAMTDAHRMFLQSIMTHGALKAREVKALYKKCCETFNRPVEHENLGKFVNEINHHVGPFSMMIQKGVSEEDGVQYYALVNMMESDITHLASDYTETELEFFKKVLDLIVDSDTGVASSTDVLNLTDLLHEEQNRKMRKKRGGGCHQEDGTRQVAQRAPGRDFPECARHPGAEALPDGALQG